MKKFIQLLVMGLVMLAATLTLQAGSATLAWGYNFAADPSVGAFKLYSLPGSNSVFTASNANASRTNTVLKAQAMLTATPGTNGVMTNLTATISNLPSGWWTFTVTAFDTNDLIESVNSANVTSAIRPAPVWNIMVQ